jgi:hypothetical protein
MIVPTRDFCFLFVMPRRLPKLIGLLLLATLALPGASLAAPRASVARRSTAGVSKAKHRLRLHRQADSPVLPPRLEKAAWHRSPLETPLQGAFPPLAAVVSLAPLDSRPPCLCPAPASVSRRKPCPKIGGLRGPPVFSSSKRHVCFIGTRLVRRILDEPGEDIVLHPLSL